MELNLTIEELRNLEQYPGVAARQSAHLSLGTGRKIVHRDYHRTYSVMSIIMMFFIFAFIGWVWEVAIHIIEDGKLVNRGALHGPWLPIYGTGGVLGVLLLKKAIDRPVVMFFLVVLLCSTVEYFTGWYLETYKHVEYWNYDGYFMNLNGRICLEGAMVFGFAGCAGIYILAPFIDDQIKKIPPKTKAVICAVLLTVFAGDFIYSRSNPNKGEGITDYIYIPVMQNTVHCSLVEIED